MNKRRKIRQRIEEFDQNLAAAKDYVARNVNIRGRPEWHLGDWKGKSGHPLWVKNHIDTFNRAISDNGGACPGGDRQEGQKEVAPTAEATE